jgi:RHS repeat-associated protein
MNNGYSRYVRAVPWANDWTHADCKWTSYQWLCPQETGGGFACNTLLPSWVQLICASGYTKTVDGHCRLNPQPECVPCSKKAGRIEPTVGNPVLLRTGAKLVTATDYESADGQFRIGRHYRSFQVGGQIDGVILPRSLPRGLVGGWNFDFGHEIQLGVFSGSPSSPSAKVAILFPDGTGYGFVLQPDGTWIPDPARDSADNPKDLKLEFVGTLPANLADVTTSSSTWKLTDGDNTIWTLQTRVDPNGGSYVKGWANQMVTRDGYAWNFAYDSDSSLASITDSFGRTATFTWYQFFTTTLASPPAGTLPYPLAIRSIALPDGTSLNYTYDPAPATSAPSTSMIQRLVKVERLSATSAVLDSVSYLYEDTRFPTHVTGVIDNRGIRTRTYAYDTQGRATSTAIGTDVDTVAYGQNGTSLTRTVNNALGKAETYTYAKFSTGTVDYRLTQVDGAASANTPASTGSLGYGTDTFISGQTDEEGNATTTTRDARGRPTTVVEGVGTASERTTTITWDPTFNVPDSVVRPGLTETRAYNTTGQLASVTLTDTTSQSLPYSTNGQTRTTTYTWDTNGRLLSINGPLAPDAQGHDDLTNYTYDMQGNLLTITDALGHVTTYGSYDANGHPGTMTDPNGIVTAYTYDPLGRVQTITVQHPTNSALNATTTIAYDAVGQVTGLTLPSTDTLTTDYDAGGRVTSVRAASGERRDYTYDAMGNISSATVRRADGSTSQQITRAFDELGRLISQTSGVGHTARQAYDKLGNVVSATSPNGNATTQAFDALGRLVTTVAPDSGSTSRSYDALDNVTSHTDPISVTTQFVYDGFGDVIQEVSPDRGTSTYWYDVAGRLSQSSDGRGEVIAYTRDYLGRLTSKVPQGRPASETVTYYWDAGGLSGSYDVDRLAKIVDGSGITQLQYDHRGNLLAKQQTIGTSAAQLVYAYDLADRVTQITYPSGRLVKYDYDSKGRVISVETKVSASAGTWTALASGYSYEPFGPLKTMTLGNGLAVAIDWGNDGRLASRRLYRTLDGTNLSYLTYRYDADDNIAAIDDQVNTAGSSIYGYDGNDRLTLAVMDGATAGSQSFTYTSGTNRLASTTDTTGIRSIVYDGRGNTATESRPGDVTAATDYDGYGRLVSYSRTDTGTQTFVYNGLDDRVAMALPSGTQTFVYDADGRVVGEYGASAADVQAEFIWALPQAGAFSGFSGFGGDDGIGGYAPLAIATPDSLGMIQLNWVYGNHLGVPIVTTDTAGNLATTPNDYLAPGFPGQSRVLADLFYNRYRDYDPITGRYVQADPIGLAGGSNPYLYAAGNPLNAIDPNGSCWMRLEGPYGHQVRAIRCGGNPAPECWTEYRGGVNPTEQIRCGPEPEPDPGCDESGNPIPKRPPLPDPIFHNLPSPRPLVYPPWSPKEPPKPYHSPPPSSPRRKPAALLDIVDVGLAGTDCALEASTVETVVTAGIAGLKCGYFLTKAINLYQDR